MRIRRHRRFGSLAPSVLDTNSHFVSLNIITEGVTELESLVHVSKGPRRCWGLGHVYEKHLDALEL